MATPKSTNFGPTARTSRFFAAVVEKPTVNTCVASKFARTDRLDNRFVPIARTATMAPALSTSPAEFETVQ